MLAKRRRLMVLLGDQVQVAAAAAAIGQTKLALEAQAWVLADQKRMRNDPGAVLRDQIVLDGLAQIGVPYKWGGASPEAGFDCSGLVTYLWAQYGYQIPHFAASQYGWGRWSATTTFTSATSSSSTSSATSASTSARATCCMPLTPASLCASRSSRTPGLRKLRRRHAARACLIDARPGTAII